MLTHHVACTEAEAAPHRALVVRAYDEARAGGWPFLSDVLEGPLRGLGEEDRAIVAGAVHALVKYDRRLAFACGSDASDARYEALWSLVRGETDLAPRLARIESATERLGTTYSFPDWLVDLLRGELGEAAESALARMNDLPPRVLRVNALKTTREACADALGREGVETTPTRSPHGLELLGRRSPFRTQAFARGDVEMQDEASQLVAELVAPPPRSLAVDACAGAGGKTLALAALLEGRGKVVAVDSSAGKLEELRRRARRAGASNVQAIRADLLDPRRGGLADPVKLEGPASRVLLDAPCTGLGAVRRNPEARWRLQPADLPRLVAAQAALLNAAIPMISAKGRIVYATCSFLPSEAELAVEFFLQQHPDFAVVTARDVLGRARTEGLTTPDGKYLRTWRFAEPADGYAQGRMDGFFAAVLRRVSS
ncbi:MAG TPA: RsmB/NOP family class I SAM-dependent RNA methyltransferase [Polyangiaceae bacterium]|nr:RsmB/NOP family class I SAM-dependent RNA methyltransferase [Polyangiaceae bacterium]